MQKNKIHKQVSGDRARQSYLSKAKFIIGHPDKGGHSEGVLINYKTDGSKPDYWYSKDCSNLTRSKYNWSFEKFGMPYLLNIFKNGGDTHTKIDLSKSQKIAIYSTASLHAQPIQTLYDRRLNTHNSSIPSKYILLAPKRLDLRNPLIQADKYFRFYSQDHYFKNNEIDLESTLKALYNKFMKWENHSDPKATGVLLVYEIATRKPIAEMSRSGDFYIPNLNTRLFPHSIETQI